ncbi:hypothetical protein PG989_016229 [Apiospora arundinis]
MLGDMMDEVPGFTKNAFDDGARDETRPGSPASRSVHLSSSHQSTQPPLSTIRKDSSKVLEESHCGSQLKPQLNAEHGVQHVLSTDAQRSELHKRIKHHDLEHLDEIVDGEIDLEVEDEHGEKPLYLSTRLGLLDVVQLLLEKGASVESQNTRSLNFPNALHQAVDKNSLPIAEVLLRHGANVNASDWNGTTPLAISVLKRELKMVDLLLQYGADKDAIHSNGVTITSLAEGSPEIQSLLQAPPLLQGPSTAQGQATKPPKKVPQSDVTVPINDKNKMISLHNFSAVIIDFFLMENSERRMMQSLSVFDLLYGDEALRKPPQHGVLLGRKPDFRWYHLPENNMDWVRALIHNHAALAFPGFTVLPDEFKHEAGLKGNRDKHHTKTPMSFMRPKCQSFNVRSHPTIDKTATHTQIKIGPDGNASDHENLVAFMPYLHHESQPRQQAVSEDLKQLLEKDSDAAEAPVVDPPGYMNTAPNDEEMHFQLRRTLDQYFFPGLDTTGRDQDQVVYRYTKERYPEPRLFMVDQLWLWVLNGDTLITCASNGLEGLVNAGEAGRTTANERNPAPAYHINPLFPFRQPQRQKAKKRTRQWAVELAQGWYSMEQFPANIASEWHNYNVPSLDGYALNVHRKIIKHLNLPNRAPIKSAYELAILAANYCTAVFDPNQTPEQFQFFDFFERSITRAASELRQQLREAGAKPDGAESQARLHTRREFDLLAETDDIQEELGILRRVLADARDVKTRLDTISAKLGHNTQQFVHDGGIMFKEYDEVEGHLERIDAMEQRVRRTSETLSYLLDQKQKRANYEGALASVSYAKQRAEIAAESARQGRTLTLFTVVTIVFLPLSFMSAFFAINIDVFPTNDDGKLELGYVLKYMLGISCGLSVPFIFVAFKQDSIAHWTRTTTDRLTGYSRYFTLLGINAIVLAVIGTGSLRSEVKVGAMIPTALFGLFFVLLLVVRWIYSLVRREQSAAAAAASSRQSVATNS